MTLPPPKAIREMTPAVAAEVGGLLCPKCGGGSRVTDSRPSTHNTIRRRRTCVVSPCHHRFTTFEITLPEAPTINISRFAESMLQQVRVQITSLQDLELSLVQARNLSNLDK